MKRYVATNLTDLHREPSFLSELLTQVMLGVELEVLEEKEKWSRVRQTDGYEGWAYTHYLTHTAAPKPTHIVGTPVVEVIAREGPERPCTRLLAGTLVHAKEDGQWAHLERGKVSSAQLRRLPLAPSRHQMIADARQFTGTYYLWGGSSAWGIDCSGLAQLVHRLAGVEIPRDCYLQFPAGRAIEPPFRAGDLLYFWNDARTKPGHVGISTGDAGGWHIIHSSRGRNGVYEEDVQQNENLRAFFCGARSFLPESIT
jgi:cell wall-associated NlpC family hydrolase